MPCFQEKPLKRLGILYLTTCVGLGYDLMFTQQFGDALMELLSLKHI